MIKSNFRTAAVACLALGAGLAASSAFAQDRFYAPPVNAGAYAQPYAADEEAAVPPNVMGHFTCSFNELNTRLERKNCGGFRYRY